MIERKLDHEVQGLSVFVNYGRLGEGVGSSGLDYFLGLGLVLMLRSIDRVLIFSWSDSDPVKTSFILSMMLR